MFKAKLNMNYRAHIVAGNGYGYNLISGLYVINTNFSNLNNPDTGKVIINVIDSLGKPVTTQVNFNDESYSTNYDGKVIIENVNNNSQYDINRRTNAQSGNEYDNDTNQCVSYEYDTSTFTGTFDFSINRQAEFTFTKNIISTSSPDDVTGKFTLTFIDDVGNRLNGVTINLNGETYATEAYLNKYTFLDIRKNTHYNFSFYKEGYVFDTTEMLPKPPSQCNTWDGERTIVGRKMTNNKSIINVVDEQNNPIKNEIIIFNNKEYTTDDTGTIIIENLKTGEKYDIKAKDEKGGELINNQAFCYNYDRIIGNFDFSQNNTITFIITKHYNKLSEKGSFHIATYYSHNYSNVKFSYVTLDFNGVTYQTDQYGNLYIHNLPYGTPYTITINVEGYYPIGIHGVFNSQPSQDLEHNIYYCNSYIAGRIISLVNTIYTSPTLTDTKTASNTLTSTNTYTPTQNATNTPTSTATSIPLSTVDNTPTTIVILPTIEPTNTPTLTFTTTNTLTPTNTYTHTHTASNTLTNTPTTTNTHTN